MSGGKHFDSDEHALLTGLLVGELRREGVEAQPVVDGGDYTPEIRITINRDAPLHARHHVVVRVLPPDERLERPLG